MISRLLRTAACVLWAIAATPALAATLTGPDLLGLAEFPVQAPTLEGTSLRFGPAFSGNFERLMNLPVSSYLVGNTLDYTIKMTRRSDDHDPIIGVSDGTTIFANYAGDNDNGTFGINLWSDYGTSSSFQGWASDTRVANVGYPPIGAAYEIRTHFEFRPEGVYVEGSMNGVVLSQTYSPATDTSNLRLVLVHDNETYEEYQLDELTIGAAEVAVTADIKPGSCPNPIGLTSKGNIPLAIAGTAGFAVADIEPVSVRLAGVAPQRHTYEDVAAPYATAGGMLARADDCTSAGGDGTTDLVLHFATHELLAAIAPVAAGDVVRVPVTGTLRNGTPISGSDVVWIRP